MDFDKIKKELQDEVLKIKVRNSVLAILFFIMQFIFVVKPIKNKSSLMFAAVWAIIVLGITLFLLFIITRNNIINSNLKFQKKIDIYVYNENSAVLKLNQEVLEYRLQAIENINVFQQLKIDDDFEIIEKVENKNFDIKELRRDFKITITNLKKRREEFSLILDSSFMKILRIDRIINELEIKRKEISGNECEEYIVIESAIEMQKELKALKTTYESIIKLLKPRVLL